ncbi:MAG: response regulator transcription factor [Synechococcaceae cyanobacterium]|nr:response regulator transcription factor [Synechococcaceae cyanobacterium]
MSELEPHPAAAPRARAHRLWILEDDTELCQLLVERCTRRGWELEPFHQPRALEQALQDSTPDLLLLDQMLPLKSGIEVLDGLRRQGHRFPVLMLSALNASSDRIAGLEHGADDYLGKPFVFRELQLRIERLLRAEAQPEPQGNSDPTHRDPAPLEASCYWIGDLLFNPQELWMRALDGTLIRLTRGDTALLLALCREPDAVLSRQTLARASGSLVDVSQSRTIDVRMSRLRRTLQDLQPDTTLLEARRGMGYRLHGVRLAEAPIHAND